MPLETVLESMLMRWSNPSALVFLSPQMETNLLIAVEFTWRTTGDAMRAKERPEQKSFPTHQLRIDKMSSNAPHSSLISKWHSVQNDCNRQAGGRHAETAPNFVTQVSAN